MLARENRTSRLARLTLASFRRRRMEGSLKVMDTPRMSRSYVSITSTLPCVSRVMARCQEMTLSGSNVVLRRSVRSIRDPLSDTGRKHEPGSSKPAATGKQPEKRTVEVVKYRKWNHLSIALKHRIIKT